MATIPNSRSLARPAKDEWGVYDPQQAGLAALFARLDKDSTPATPAAAGPAARKDVAEPKRQTPATPARPASRGTK